MKILSIVGTRPQIIKHYVMSMAYRKWKVRDFVVYTGQHSDYDMSSIFFKEFRMKKPDVYLDGYGKYGERLGKIVDGVNNIHGKFNYGVVYGDCDSTLGGALAIKKMGIPLVHIESGLRCWDNSMIEERNRVLVDGISDIRFCPTRLALKNLSGKGEFVGNLNLELHLKIRDKVKDSEVHGYTLVTCHREESLRDINKVIHRVARYPNVVFVCHPHTRKVLEGKKLPFSLIEPVSYMNMQSYIKNAELVVTDSGGVTQEAWMWGKKVVNLRSTTEWKETTGKVNLSKYGNGKTSDIIVNHLVLNRV